MTLRVLIAIISLIVLNTTYINTQTNSGLTDDDLRVIAVKLHNYDIVSNQNRLLNIKNGLCLSNNVIYTQQLHIKDNTIHNKDNQIKLHFVIHIALTILLVIAIL